MLLVSLFQVLCLHLHYEIDCVLKAPSPHLSRGTQCRACVLTVLSLVCVVIWLVDGRVGPSELATDCSVDPWAHSCHPASMMDMINNVGHRARSNAIAQHKLKMQLLAEQKLMLKHEETKEEKHNKKVIAKEDASGKGFAKTVYKGVDITSKASVDSEIKKWVPLS